MSKDEFDEIRDDDEFVEWAENFGNSYGTSFKAVKAVVEEQDKICILDVDVQGVKAIEAKKADLGFEARFVFIRPPSMDELEKRLRERATENDESLRKV